MACSARQKNFDASCRSVSIYDKLATTPAKKVSMTGTGSNTASRSRSTSAGSSPANRSPFFSEDGMPVIRKGDRDASPLRIRLNFEGCKDLLPMDEPAVVHSSLGAARSLPAPPPGLEDPASVLAPGDLPPGLAGAGTSKPLLDSPAYLDCTPTFQCTGMVPPLPPYASTFSTSAPVFTPSAEPSLMLPAAGLEAVPTVGSAGHGWGACRPCAFMHTKGCENGFACQFCHICPPGEKKRRKKAGAAVAAATSIAAAYAVQVATNHVMCAAMPYPMPR